MSDVPVELEFEASSSSGNVSALLLRPAAARWLLVMGHGAGAGMRHAFMESTAQALAERGIATFRYNFPYMESGTRRPNPAPILHATVRSAIAAAREAAGDLPVLAGGKSMGGRMTSLALSATDEPDVRGIVFFGFPLHAPGRVPAGRADHLSDVRPPMLFLQGTRDRLAELDRIRPACESLGEKATLHVVEGADHSFHVLKRSGRTDPEVLEELADAVAAWTEALDPAPAPTGRS